ncbi:hypothetical protein Hanom_Chr02g00142761 [Helianthus anomalus]
MRETRKKERENGSRPRPCVCAEPAAFPSTGGLVVTREIISVRWCRIQCAVPVVTESVCGFGDDGIRVRFWW